MGIEEEKARIERRLEEMAQKQDQENFGKLSADTEKARIEKWQEITDNIKAITASGKWVEENSMDETKWEMGEWFNEFSDERQRKEILWALEYDQPNFRHGTVGHNQLLIIAKLARLLNEMEKKLAD